MKKNKYVHKKRSKDELKTFYEAGYNKYHVCTIEYIDADWLEESSLKISDIYLK